MRQRWYHCHRPMTILQDAPKLLYRGNHETRVVGNLRYGASWFQHGAMAVGKKRFVAGLDRAHHVGWGRELVHLAVVIEFER